MLLKGGGKQTDRFWFQMTSPRQRWRRSGSCGLFSLRRRPSLYRCGPWKRHRPHCFLTLLNQDHSRITACFLAFFFLQRRRFLLKALVFLPPTEKLWSLKDRKRRSPCFSHLLPASLFFCPFLLFLLSARLSDATPT